MKRATHPVELFCERYLVNMGAAEGEPEKAMLHFIAGVLVGLRLLRQHPEYAAALATCPPGSRCSIRGRRYI